MEVREYAGKSALELGRLVAGGEVGAEELLDAAIAAMEAVNPQVNAVVLQHLDQARGQIRAGLPQGPLSGVPFLLKDLYAVMAGTQLTNGSRGGALGVAGQDCELVRRFRDAGLVLFGKTNSPEFGLTVTTEPVRHGPTRNPWNTGHSAGGSSGGAGAAVAAGIVPVAHASDGGGSIRIPASCCGLFGLKPTRARTPSGPFVGEGWFGQSISHVVSRTVRDSAAALDAIQGPEPGAPYAAPHWDGSYLQACEAPLRKLRVALAPDGHGPADPSPEVAQAVRDAGKMLEDLGHSVEEAAPQLHWQEIGVALISVISAAVAMMLDRFAEEQGREATNDDFEAMTLYYAARGREVLAPQMLRVRQIMCEATLGMDRFLDGYDLYVSPVLAAEPVPLGHLDLNTTDVETYSARIAPYTPYTGVFNQTGHPSASLPLGWSGQGLPIGVMATAAKGAEELLLQVAAQLEEASGWAGKRPGVWAGGPAA